jgi:hypothetical protein
LRETSLPQEKQLNNMGVEGDLRVEGGVEGDFLVSLLCWIYAAAVSERDCGLLVLARMAAAWRGF